MEFDNASSMRYDGGRRCFHTVCLGPKKEDGNPYIQFEESDKLDPADAPDQEAYQPYLDELHRGKNLTIYCHPEWSSTPARYFDKMQGNFAMEIWNTGGAMDCDMDKDAAYWDELLGMGNRIYGVATDDGHGMDQHCKGWVMVNSEKDVNSVLKALENGAFYSSCGPEIYDFYVEDGKAVIDCSPVKMVRLHSDGHATKIQKNDEGYITHAEISLGSMPYAYVRVSIVDESGKMAWTNPIFLNE
jgi:hypothetical protein